MPVVLLGAAAVILVGMIVVAVGRGGEMAEFSADVRPIDADIATAADVALLRPPVALWGYDRRSTDEALNLIARTVTERDVEIATLRRQIADMQSTPESRSAAQHDAATLQDPIWGPDGGGLGATMQPGQADPRTDTSQFVRRQASPAPPPAETQPWSAWDQPGPAQRPEPGALAEPGETR
jgi:hypothetical protein